MGLDPERFTIAFVGKLDPDKRLGDAIAALALVDNAQLIVAGSGRDEAACRAEATRRALPVTFAGFVPEVADVLRTSPKAIYSMAERGQLPGVVRIGRRLLVKRAELLLFVDHTCALSSSEKRR